MMNDPSFVAEMKKVTESSQFKGAMDRAAQDIEKLNNDPVAMAKMKQQAKQAGLL